MTNMKTCLETRIWSSQGKGEYKMKDLKEMTSKELKEIAKGMKISNWWNLKKAVLIEKIEEIQSMTDEEKQAIVDQKAKEDAALNEYQKNWRKYTKRFNPIEFMEKFRSGEITLDDGEEIEETEKPMWKKYINSDVSDEEVKALNNYDKYWNDFDQVYDPESYLNSLRNKEEKEDQPEETPEPETKEDKNELIAKKNIENAYNWIVGGNENSVLDGEMSQEEFDSWIANNAFNEILDEAMSSKYEADSAGGKAPTAMKRVRKSICKEYLLSLFKADDYDVNIEIKEQEGHKPTPKRGALIEFDGKAQNICAWGEELRISPNTLYGRIYKMGWSVERAFTTPTRKTK